MKTLWLFVGLALSAPPSHAAEFQDGSPKRAMFGEHPTGYIIFTREGRLIFERVK